ncbi:MAG: caspase family protein [Armatimonadetes bacterium]|nr:caspase family protein [Armatimonadota bacterium]
MRALVGIVLMIFLVLLTGQPALADKRVALVIGNSAYRNVAKLENPVHDASAVAAMFKSAGFDSVESKLNLTVSELRKALRDFGNTSRGADVAVVYYAGHGIELDGTNYLIPVDATLETDTDVLDEALPLDRVLVAVEPAKRLRLIILDACRDNPFAKNMKRTMAARAIGRGLAKVEPSSPNTVIAFAAKAGSTAYEGTGKNSPFAMALVEHLVKPGLDLQRAFRYVRDDVLKATNNAQEPYTYTSLGGDDVPLVSAAPAKPAVAPIDQDVAMRRDYDYAERIGTKPVWDAFIEKYPFGFFTALAKAQRDKLAAEAARIEATNKAKAAEEERRRLAIEGAKAPEQTKAAAQASAAEKDRIAAEQAKKVEETKVAEAERTKAAALAKAAEKEAERLKTAEAANATRAKLAADQKANGGKLAAELKAKEEKLAALNPTADKTDQLTSLELPRSLQAELRRVGCNSGAVDGTWNAASQRSLDLFNKHAGMKLDVKKASADALEAVKGKANRVCPLVCDHGFRADSDRCTRITCRAGFEVGDDNTCEKIEVKKPTAKREEPKRERRERSKAEVTPSTPQASGQIVCDAAGCRPIKKGCRLVQRANPGNQTSVERCN